MGISFSNIGTVGREQLITSGGNGEQNWSYIPSKGKSTKKANNRAYQFADEKTKKQIAYMSGYYLQTVPQRDRKSTRLNSSHNNQSRMPSSA